MSILNSIFATHFRVEFYYTNTSGSLILKFKFNLSFFILILLLFLLFYSLHKTTHFGHNLE